MALICNKKQSHSSIRKDVLADSAAAMTEPMEALRAVGNLQYLLDSLDDGDADLRALRDGVATQVNPAATQILHIAVVTLCSEVTIKKVEENSSFATSVCWMLKKFAKTSRTFGELNAVTPGRATMSALVTSR